MQASIVDLRYKMKEVLKALSRHERVKILYHGKVRGTIIPNSKKPKLKVSEHEFFGMTKDGCEKVTETLNQLRGGRYNAV
ncbi:MAG: type II toxin-antitoxin system Phd/YefM family antitoxin [Deltaproteobacteria bacterium]|nr:type II toxin-antitoxin system Phd/YefM family antitoxin [Deltaproteobacteria bacterium]